LRLGMDTSFRYQLVSAACVMSRPSSSDEDPARLP
jgi:hypothetical protein